MRGRAVLFARGLSHRGRAVAIAGAVLAVLAIAGIILTHKTYPVRSLLVNNSMSVTSVAFSPSGEVLAAGNEDGTTFLWNADSGKRMSMLSDPAIQATVASVAFSPNGKLLATGTGSAYAGSACLWNAATGKLLVNLSDPPGYYVDSVAFSPHGTTLAAGGNDDADQPASTPPGAYLWDIGRQP
jgi:WD40 repeat protein